MRRSPGSALFDAVAFVAGVSEAVGNNPTDGASVAEARGAKVDAGREDGCVEALVRFDARVTLRIGMIAARSAKTKGTTLRFRRERKRLTPRSLRRETRSRFVSARPDAASSSL